MNTTTRTTTPRQGHTKRHAFLMRLHSKGSDGGGINLPGQARIAVDREGGSSSEVEGRPR